MLESWTLENMILIAYVLLKIVLFYFGEGKMVASIHTFVLWIIATVKYSWSIIMSLQISWSIMESNSSCGCLSKGSLLMMSGQRNNICPKWRWPLGNCALLMSNNLWIAPALLLFAQKYSSTYFAIRTNDTTFAWVGTSFSAILN
jgi:hypothetical protein